MSAPSGYTALDFVGFTDKGTYSPIVNYMRNDLVHYGGNIMRCLIDNTKNVTPVVGANWELWVGASANLVERVIAPLENNPADVAFGVGRQIIYDDWLWEVIAPIEVGDALIDYAVDPTNANIKKSAPVETQLLAVKAEADATDNMIAPTEASASSSSAAYSVGDQLILNNILYDVIAAIQIGDALTTGTGGNIKAADNLTDQLKEVDSLIQTLTNNDDAMLNVLGAKNLLPNTATTQTISGVTFTVNPDGSVRINGTNNTSNPITFFVSGVNTISLTNYIVAEKVDLVISMGTERDEDVVGVLWGCRDSITDALTTSFASGGDLVIQSLGHTIHINGVALRVLAGKTVNKTYYPMIRPASVKDNTYVPYAKTNRELTELTKNNIGDAVSLSTSDYVAPSDGYVIANIGYGRGRYLFVSVNGIALIQISTPSDASEYANAPMTSYQTASLFVKKGMVLKITSKSSYGDEYAMFRPII